MSVSAFLPRTSRFSDVLMNYHFHLLDVSISTPITLSLAYGFQHCTAPNITVKTKDIKEGTFEYPHHVMESATTDEINMISGAKFGDSDFYDWITGYVRGEPYRRRNLLLIQYSEVGIANLGAPTGSAIQPLFDLVARVPARSWLLHSCIPTGYKSSTDDFDALSHGVSLQSLTIQCKFPEEFNSGV